MSSIRPLIAFQEGQGYVLDEDTAAWLSARTKPFAVLACAGKFRTGKSFLLNRLLRLPPGKGFGVGETVQACTRGIWLCTDFLSNGDDDGTDVLVLDTEGIDALDAESEHDVRVFALAVLLCTSLAYNSMSHLDEAAVQALSLMTRVAEAVPKTTETTASSSPSLYWILRDFSLQLVDSHNKPMTHAAYLEQALAPVPGGSKCATREAIATVFPHRRHLVTLPRPHNSAQKLDHKSADTLAPKFVKFLDTFRTHLCTHAQPFAVAGVPVTGRVYVELVRSLVRTVNEEGSLPKVEDSWTLLAKVQHAEAERMAREEVMARVETECPTAVEGEVDAFVERTTTALLSTLRFVPPSPDLAGVRGRLQADAKRHAKALGRVKDLAKLAEERAEERCERVRRLDADVDSLFAVPEDVPWESFAPALVSRLARTHLLDELRAAAQAKARAETLHEVRVDTERLEAEVESLRLTLEEERVARSSSPSLSFEDAATSTEDLWPPASPRSLRDDEAEARTLEDDACDEASHKMILELEACLHAADARAEEANAAVKAAESREAATHAAFDASMDALRGETVERLDVARKDTEAARTEAKTRADQAKVLEEECTRLRALAREAQEKTVDVHKTTLEELRRRDAEAREAAERGRREHGEVHARAERASAETRALKRRVDELLDMEGEVKRLRTLAQDGRVEKAKEEVEKEALRAQLAASRADVEALRTAHTELQSRLAVLQATAKLESCRRAIV